MSTFNAFKTISRSLLPMLLAAHAFAVAEPPSDGIGISLSESIQRAEAYAPFLQAANAEVEQFESLGQQQSLFPNPSMVFDVENIGGSQTYSGTDSAEYTLSLEQRVELGKKRSMRKRLASIDLEDATLRLERARELLHAEVRKRFLEVAIAHQEAELAQRRLDSAQRAEHTAVTRQEVGAANALDRQRMELAVSLEQIKTAKAHQTLQSSLHRLASLWGASAADFDSVSMEFSIPEELPTQEQLLSSLRRSLSWRISDTEIERQQTLIQLEQSAAYPDLTLSAGRRWLRADRAEAWNLGVAIDLPLFDRNQHRVAAATAASRQSNHEVAAQRQQLLEQVTRIHDAMRSSWNAARDIENVTLPKANQTYQLVSDGYELGRYELLYLLEVQQTLFEIESVRLQALFDYQRSCVALFEILADTTPAPLKF